MKQFSVSKHLRRIAAGPAAPENTYIRSKITYKEIYAMAGNLADHHFSADQAESVCLCTTDRALAAAALIAALTRPVTLVIPYALSADVLAQTHQANGFSKAIVDSSMPLPPGVKPVSPDPTPARQNRPAPDRVRDPDSVFVKLFTGGSTQTPRIWSKTIGNLFGEAVYHARKLEVTPADSIIPTVPAYHIYGLLFSVLMPLAAGASVIAGEPTYPHEIRHAVGKNRATILVSVPLHYRLLTGIAFDAQNLRFALSSAAKLEPADSHAFYRQTGLGITEVFGSTETGGIATRLCTLEQPHFTPFDCIEWKIKDNLLAIRSDFISPELPVDADGFFVTSDRANAAGPDGFELAGRADRIVKVGGKRVDLEEVRSAITGMPDVSDAAVICTDNSGGRGNEIRALVAAPIKAGQIRQHLQNHLPGYCIPRRIRVIKQLPVTPAGKYDRTEIEKLLEA